MNIYRSNQLIKLESIEILPESPEFKIEEIIAEIPQFKCTLCPLQFHEKEELHSHVRDHFQPITCKECNKTLIGDKQYTYHLKHIHNGKRTINETLEHGAPADGSAKGNVIALVKKERLEEISIDPIESTANVACDICGRLFPNISAIARHRKTHSSEKRFNCAICGTGFNKKTNLEFHMRIHTNERPFTCDQCPKSFAHVSGLNCHRRVHSGERPYKCPFCDKCYAHSTDLRRHRRTHGLEEKRFSCSLCEKQFYESKFLRSHMKSHYDDDDAAASKTVQVKSESKFLRTQIKSQRDDDTAPLAVQGKNVISRAIQISNLDECSNEEYIDYEYIQSD